MKEQKEKLYCVTAERREAKTRHAIRRLSGSSKMPTEPPRGGKPIGIFTLPNIHIKPNGDKTPRK